jgi:selenocysteine-specific elongation factor
MIPTVVIGTAGHIDHGKSALVKALTGTDPDRLKEEQARGITIDLGFAHTVVDDVNVAFVDVPGHERFVRNMLAGAGGIDAVALVIAADESVMPQTREHFEICRLLGVERGLIVLSKSDRVDADSLEVAALEARELVAGSFLEAAPVIAVSARTGAGLDELRRALHDLAGRDARQQRAGVVRLPVDRVFTVKGFGTVVTGTLVSGEIRAGDELVVLPEGRAVRVRGVQTHGRDVASASAPARAAVNLGAIEVSDLARGVTLSSADSLSVTRRIDARIELIEKGHGLRALRHGARVRVHHGTAERLGRVAICAVASEGELDWRLAAVGEKLVEAVPGGRACVRLRLEQPMALTRGDRFILRAYSPPVTIGGGVVLDPMPPAAGLRRAATLARFQALAPGPSSASGAPGFVRVWLGEAGARGLAASDLVARGGLDAGESRRAMAALVDAGDAVPVGARIVDVTVTRTIEARVIEELKAFHAREPKERGVPREALRERAAPHAPAAVIDDVLERMAAAGTIAGADRVALTTHRATASPEEDQHAARVAAVLRDAGLMPPDSVALAVQTGLPAAIIARALADLARERTLVRLEGLFFHAEALARLRQEVQQMGASGATPGALVRVDVATFKDRYGLSRKFAIPLLEWLDRERVTRRVGDARVILGG